MYYLTFTFFPSLFWVKNHLKNKLKNHNQIEGGVCQKYQVFENIWKQQMD